MHKLLFSFHSRVIVDDDSVMLNKCTASVHCMDHSKQNKTKTKDFQAAVPKSIGEGCLES